MRLLFIELAEKNESEKLKDALQTARLELLDEGAPPDRKNLKEKEICHGELAVTGALIKGFQDGLPQRLQGSV